MMSAQNLHEALRAHGFEYFVGVPDSILAAWIDHASQQEDTASFQIASSEGEALALAIGYQLATGKRPLVFLQNSGLGNLINPLMSLAHPEVYRIPLTFLIGWRGMPGSKDEPQHLTMGRASEAILDVCGVESHAVHILEDVGAGLSLGATTMHALLMAPGCLPSRKNPSSADGPLRIQYLEQLLKLVPEGTALFATTGFTSRELWALQKEKPSHACFYGVGGMGYINALALGFAQQQKSRLSCVLDGDGALLMHLGNLASIGARPAARFLHILFRNEAHESTGAQQLAATPASWAEVARVLGYKHCARLSSFAAFQQHLPEFLQLDAPAFLEVDIPRGTFEGLPRPSGTPSDWLHDFRSQLS